MAGLGFGGLPVRLQQLKMQLRMSLNAILDQLVHCEDMTEAEAMALMTGRGFQEEGEAAGKWRRALLTSTQLSTYFVGYTEVAGDRRGPPVRRDPARPGTTRCSRTAPRPRATCAPCSASDHPLRRSPLPERLPWRSARVAFAVGRRAFTRCAAPRRWSGGPRRGPGANAPSERDARCRPGPSARASAPGRPSAPSAGWRPARRPPRPAGCSGAPGRPSGMPSTPPAAPTRGHRRHHHRDHLPGRHPDRLEHAQVPAAFAGVEDDRVEDAERRDGRPAAASAADDDADHDHRERRRPAAGSHASSAGSAARPRPR